MKIKILGSGGAIPTPRPLCCCKVCQQARVEGVPYKRNSCSIYIEDIKTLIDCPEDIGDSLNREGIVDVANLLITHWHPDHVFGLRILLEANYDFIRCKAIRVTNLYIPSKVYKMIKQKYPTIDYLIDTMKLANLHLVEDGEVIDFGDVSVRVVGYAGKNSETYAYLFKSQAKSALFILCDSIGFEREVEFKNLDLLVHECGIFSYEIIKHEISFPDMIKRFKHMLPSKVVLLHIEEIELKTHGLGKLKQLEKKNRSLNLTFAYDGLMIKL